MSNELTHYGVKGMKWGVRRQRRTPGYVKTARANLSTAKSERKTAKKEYNKAFKKSSTLYGAYGPGNKQRHAKTYETAKKYNSANKAYKKAKKDYKNALNADNRKYTKQNREEDVRQVGKGGVKRINRDMNKGNSYTTALAKEYGRQAAAATLVSLGVGFVASGGAKEVGRMAVTAYMKKRGVDVTWR